jgi:LemA family
MAPSLQRQDQISDAAYPDLKANQNMLALQEELTSTENKIGFPASVQRNAARHRTFLVTQRCARFSVGERIRRTK